MCRSSGAALYTFFKQASAAVQVVEFPSPFKRFKALVRSVLMYIKASPLGGVRKITPLTQGQIIRTVESMYVGGFGMMQVRSVPSAHADADACLINHPAHADADAGLERFVWRI